MRTVALRDIAEVKLGRQRSPKNHFGDSMRPYLRAANIGWGGLLLDDVKTMNFTDAEMDTFRLQQGDLLLGEASGSPSEVGKPALWAGELEECAFQNTLLRVRPSREADSRFLLHYFMWQASSGAFARGVRGVGIHHLGREMLAGWPIPLPDIQEQQRIVEILDQADAVRANRRESVHHLNTLAQSIFDDMFGGRDYTPVNLSSLVDAEDRMNYGVVQPGDHVPDGIPLIRVSNLSDGGVDRRSIKRISPSIEAGYSRARIRGNEILVSCVGSIGEVSVVSSEDVNSNIARAITRIPVTDPAMRTYVAAYLRTAAPQRYFRSELRTVAQPTLNVGQLASTPIPLPSQELVAAYSNRVSKVAVQKEAVTRSLILEQELFTSLEARAFSGEI